MKGAGWTWGHDITSKFLHQNKLKLITRSHQLVMDVNVKSYEIFLIFSSYGINQQFGIGIPACALK